MKQTTWHISLTILAAALTQTCFSWAQKGSPIPNASKTPHYTFSDTLEEQLEELKTNPLLERFRVSRAQLLQDPHHPIFHFTSPENRLNDPNGLCFWNGQWHMFYQGYPPEHPRQHWGHAISDDLIHWRDLPYAIYPGPERACFSGSVFVEKGRAIAMYHGTEVGTMAATSSDPLLLNWEKVTGGPVIPYPQPGEPQPEYNIFDPCIWKHGDRYYALTAGPKGGMQFRSMYLHRSEDLAKWEHLHEFLEHDRFSLAGDDGACPYFWPIGSGENQKHILCHFSHMSGGKYILGTYDTEHQKFVVENGGDFNFGSWGPCGLHAPSAYPDGKGGVNVIFNVNEGKPTKGWNRMMSLPRNLTLREDGTFNPLNIEPAGDVESLRGDQVHIGKTTLPANKEIVLDNVSGNSMEIVAEIAPEKGQTIELNVLRSADGEEVTRIQCFRDRGMRILGNKKSPPTVVSIDSSRSTIAGDVLGRPPETATVDMGAKEPLKLRVFVDRSIVEVFINGRQCLTARVYPDRDDSLGVSLRAQGRDATLTSLDAWRMESIYE
jgi:beta-fructofuranosidase